MDSRQIVDEIKQKLPIEAVVGSYIQLKRAGRLFKANCPFHGEKTPSFTVNPERNVFKCFGCGESGDIFAFVMKIEGLTFPEALAHLAEKAGVALPDKSAFESQGPSRGKIASVNEFAANFWHKLLMEHPSGKDAKDYLLSRGLTETSIKKFRIGYAPLGQVNATKFAQAKLTRDEIQAAGDPTKFQDRITFPIADITGRVVGFTGRILEHPNDTQKPGVPARGPKYWNTPETLLFVKSRTLYALDQAKHAIQENNEAILAEGQMDVVMLHQFGYVNAVASSGTALTKEQLELIQRFTPSVTFCYDGDKAGREATKKGLTLALSLELTPYVIRISGGKDPADWLLSDQEGFAKAHKNKQLYFDWILDELAPKETLSELTTEAKRQIAKELTGWLHSITDLSEQAEQFRKASARLQTSEDNLRELYRRLYPHQQVSKPRIQPSIQPLPTTNNRANVVLALVAALPESSPIAHSQIAVLKKSPYRDEFIPIIEGIEKSNLPQLLANLDQTSQTALSVAIEEELVEYSDTELTAPWVATELAVQLRHLRDEQTSTIRSRVAAEIQSAQAEGDLARVQELFKELHTLL